MKKVTCFYLTSCPYCRQAFRALKELIAENAEYEKVDMEWIEESDHPEISKNYDYYYVPTMFIGNAKHYEARPGESFEECKGHVKEVLDEALR